ncbi:ATP-grasp peptide maturase system methyltransferase [Actinomadura litoris]|uniref:ATP-grasp peptide maturase system methyltransferase n=1 Tax=Actinomadura litoris TaxID=2678616 RepID=UPI001FA73DBB|nr:ATP-grasp peptide maturase system methyltransferase [Actinomadura litoris]
MITTNPASARLRRALADRLEADGDLRTPTWRAAVEQVPREMFLGEGVYRRHDTADGTLWEPITLARVGEARWLELVYEDTTWVTQLTPLAQPSEPAEPGQVPGAVQGVPTSSSTLPGLVVRMLEHLEVQDGDRVLEIGTGTGYSTALICHRLGNDQVTSVEIDPDVAARAATALTAAGHRPTLITGDGLAGHPDGAPYDRIIAACSVRTIPTAWITQATPGARILTTMSGWLYGFGLLALEVTGDGTAHGRFLRDTVSFMPARPHAAPPLPADLPAPEGEARPPIYGASILDEWMGRFLAQLAAPTAQRLHLPGDDATPPADLLIDQATGSHAWLTSTDTGSLVQQHGPARLWDQIEHTYQLWDQAGRPTQDHFTVHITPHAQSVRVDTSDDPSGSWPLPTRPGVGMTRA